MATTTEINWTQIPPAPKVPNYWQGGGYTLVYASPGWSVYEGTFAAKAEVEGKEVLFHSRKAAEAKQWVAENAKPARKPRTRKPKADSDSSAKRTRKPASYAGPDLDGDRESAGDPPTILGTPYGQVNADGSVTCPECQAKISEDHDAAGEATTNNYGEHFTREHGKKLTGVKPASDPAVQAAREARKAKLAK